MGSTDYVLYAHDASPSSRVRTALTLLLAVCIGLGSHASKESLAPAEPALEEIGLGEISYALLSVCPIMLGVITPLGWGVLWDSSRRWVMLLAPIGECVGAILVAIGVRELAAEPLRPVIVGSLLLAGLAASSLCKAGIAIAQFSLVGRVCGGHTALSFAVLVTTKHLISISAMWGVPLVLAAHGAQPASPVSSPPADASHSPLDGVVRVSLLTLVPHAISCAAAIALFFTEPSDETETGMSVVRQLSSGARSSGMPPGSTIVDLTPSIVVLDDVRLERPLESLGQKLLEATPQSVGQLSEQLLLKQTSSMRDETRDETLSEGRVACAMRCMRRIGRNCERGGAASCVWEWSRRDARSCRAAPCGQVVALLGLWRALAVGALHAFHSVRVQLLVSTGLPTIDAGACWAFNDAMSMCVLPLLCVVGSATGLRPMLPLAPVVAIFATLLLLHYVEHDGLAHDASAPPADELAVMPPYARVALHLLSLCELATPIVPLALLPANALKLGTAYGALESIFVVVQMTLTLLLGVVRTFSGFPGALVLVCGGFVCTAALSVPLVIRANDVPRRYHLKPLCCAAQLSES